MAKVVVFNSVSIDGYFTGPDGDLSWAHRANDPEWKEFISGNAKGNARLLFGRVTYEMMVNYWPTPMAAQNDPVVAEGMNKLPKIVFSRTLNPADHPHVRVTTDDPATVVAELTRQPGGDIWIFGGGNLFRQLADASIVDSVEVALVPVLLGSGIPLLPKGARMRLSLRSHRIYPGTGTVLLQYDVVR